VMWPALSRGKTMFYVYVLLNPKNEIYVGQTDDLTHRHDQHNDPEFLGTLHTKRRSGPWHLIHAESLATRAEAMKREKQLKSSRGRAWVREVLIPQVCGAQVR
jgi:putative endonuclease